MNKLYGKSKRDFNQLYDDVVKTLCENDYHVFGWGKRPTGVGSLQCEIISLTVLERSSEYQDFYFSDGGQATDTKVEYGIADIQIIGIAIDASKIVINPTAYIDHGNEAEINEIVHPEDKSYRNVVELIKSLGVTFEGERPNSKDVPWEKIPGENDEKKLYVKYWCVANFPGRKIAEKFHVVLGTYSNAINDLRKAFPEAEIPKGQSERRKFREKFAYYLPEWESELEKIG